MPTVVVDGPPMKSIEQKRTMVQRLTDAAAEVYGYDKMKISVIIRENPPENVGRGGRLIADLRGE
ncbi:hypothetical protein AMJ71_07880 [candidate division TA06 bacterium SM1_40]|uniref:Tautomerase n=2 Tax=Bacteria division TA06 TaxID=1156500 RepID=A0A0S8JG37_UNCT6|nr:MAG: hypothetical protein AMJ82_09620 [candidate division TA06 bacterium SM23_40]KPL08632.1 MAG: hypothetical protein AMJ71_07880 [candidate division TA06 bacterium SM1_40]